MPNIEIDAKPPPCAITLQEAVGGREVGWFHAAFVPAIGDEVEIKVERERVLDVPYGQWLTVRVLRRRWDLSDEEAPSAMLFVERVED